MKKLLLTILPILAASYSYAQTWQPLNGNLYLNVGNVGIGVPNPIMPLEVNGIIKANNSLFLSTVLSGGIGLNITNNLDADFQVGVSAASATYRFAQIGSSVQNVPLLINPSNRGYVGIGVTNPSSILHIAAASDNQITINNTSPTLYGNENQSIVFNGTNNGSDGRILELLRLKVTSTNGGIAAGRVDFSQNGSTKPTLSFAPNKYVGIGTSSPNAPLTVNGTIHATEILVDQNVPTPDYVFDKDYDLTSLKDVKTYIEKNHHLPEIPSAAQAAKEGINLGEMNAKLLKKIEELTLYLIEQKEETEALKIQVKKLSEQQK